MSGTLALSSLIASLDRAALSELVRQRRIPSPNSVSDPLDLATELLKPDSIAQAVTLLPRSALLQLLRGTHASAAAGDGAAPQEPGVAPTEEARGAALLAQLGLTGAAGAELPEVTATLTELLAARGLSGTDLALAPETRAESDELGDTTSWYAAALATTGQAAWILRDLERAPAKLNRNGDVAAAWLRAAEERLAITAADELVVLLRSAGLASGRDGWCVSLGDAWLRCEHAERWIALADAAVARMPEALLTELHGIAAGQLLAPVVADFPRQYPLANEATTALITDTTRLWERLGITVDGRFSEPGVATLARHAAGGADTASTSDPSDLGLPATAPGIYIQPDLSVVVPGPLSPADEAALAAIALPEQIGVASTLRISEATLSEAFHRGLTGPEIRELIGGLTLTGIPQPVDYLITTLSERAGSIIVVPHFGDEGRTRIEFHRPELRATMLVDRRLAHLQLQDPPADLAGTTEPGPLLSRLRADHVLAALLDARYPARGGGGLLPVPEPTPGAQSSADAAAAAVPVDAKQALIDRVLESNSSGPTDISRQVTLAIRDRNPLRVTVEVRGHVREFSVLPVSLAAGRLRALDEAAGVERTLPLDAITAIAPLATDGTG